MSDLERTCAGCKHPLTPIGIRQFRTGGSDGGIVAFFGALAEADETLLTVALYGCSICGRLEMFLPPVAS